MKGSKIKHSLTHFVVNVDPNEVSMIAVIYSVPFSFSGVVKSGY